MKFYRRHKHELNHTETDDPLPQVPEKKMRYSRADDVLLAKFFFNKPDGTSDKIFQAFGRLVSLLTVLFYCCFRSVITFSTHITHGRVGRNTIGFISRRLTTLFNGLAKAISLTNPIRQLSRERGETSFFFQILTYTRFMPQFVPVSLAFVRTRIYVHGQLHCMMIQVPDSDLRPLAHFEHR